MLTKKIIFDLYCKCATDFPVDVQKKLNEALENEKNDNAKAILKTIIENIDLARSETKPLCQDTGTPFFYIRHPCGMSEKDMISVIEEATKEATEKIPLRPNAVDSITGENIGNKPVIHFEDGEKLKIDLLMKGGGSENVSCIYSLPNTELKANRDIDGIKRCVIDSVFRAQGKGCSPYIIGVAAGGSIEEVAHLSKKQLLRDLYDSNIDETLNNIETSLLRDINKLGIGPMGLGGETTILSVKVGKLCRHPASFFVGVSFGCWALRRASYE